MAMRWDRPVAARLLTTVMLASVVTGVLSNHWDHTSVARRVEVSRVAPASPEMMRLLRDEHDLVAEMVKAQLAASDSSFDSKPIAAAGRRQAIAMR
jgi:hypothetical protein